jgi:hypothetical protein
VFQNDPLVFLSRGTLRDYDLHTEGLANRNVNAPQSPGWNPLCDRAANVAGEGCFTQSEILDVREKSKAAYLMLRFGGPDANLGSVNVVGNVGVRFVRTEVESHGQVSFPTADWYTSAQGSGQGACDPANNTANQATDIQCWLTPALQAFSTGTGQDNAREDVHERVAQLQRALRVHRQAVHAVRLLETISRADFRLLRNSCRSMRHPSTSATARLI